MNQLLQTKPTPTSNRIELLDMFRGFALLGIFVVNIRFMSSSVIYLQEFTWMSEGTYNGIASWILDEFFNGKFFPIFSFLFGVGFGMQINKMEEKGNFNSFFFIRRYFFLLVFGLIHIIFIWGGDVLALYAIAGMLVLLIRKIPVKYTVILSLLILFCPFYGHALDFANNLSVQLGYGSLLATQNYSYQDIVNIKTMGSFHDNLNFRLNDYSVYYRNAEYFPLLLSMIFLGYSAGRIKFYNRIPEIVKKLTYIAIAAVIIVIAIRFFYSAFEYKKSGYPWYVFLTKLSKVSDVLQSFLYLYIISLLYVKGYFTKILEPLAYAGRMSLTNYIMQSVMGFVLFNGAFFGLYGKLGVAWLGVISLTVYLLLLLGSKIWLNYFRFGPLEWVWRELSYRTSLKISK